MFNARATACFLLTLVPLAVAAIAVPASGAQTPNQVQIDPVAKEIYVSVRGVTNPRIVVQPAWQSLLVIFDGADGTAAVTTIQLAPPIPIASARKTTKRVSIGLFASAAAGTSAGPPGGLPPTAAQTLLWSQLQTCTLLGKANGRVGISISFVTGARPTVTEIAGPDGAKDLVLGFTEKDVKQLFCD